MDRLAQTLCRAFNLVITTALLAGAEPGRRGNIKPRSAISRRRNVLAVDSQGPRTIRHSCAIQGGRMRRHCGNVAFPIAVAVDRRFSKLN
jgi:hypothetical protein